MGKETREMLKTILSNTQLIMKHLKIESVENNKPKKEKPVTVKKIIPKKGPSSKK